VADQKPDTPGNPRTSVKAPLLFSLILGLVAGVVTLVVSSGGSSHHARWDLGGIAFGAAFIVCLVVAAMLSMSYKENPEHLSQGSGVNRRSSDRLKKPTDGSPHG
jgi:hypothetical protein